MLIFQYAGVPIGKVAQCAIFMPDLPVYELVSLFRVRVAGSVALRYHVPRYLTAAVFGIRDEVFRFLRQFACIIRFRGISDLYLLCENGSKRLVFGISRLVRLVFDDILVFQFFPT